MVSFPGYYQTKSQTFYSIYEHTNRHNGMRHSKNFILENYMILTCDYEIDRKSLPSNRQS